ncbi:adaptin AP complex subunit Alpha [Cryptosporidium ubiquitum]|uniref:Adaptin AP complex subunit Alpha n=1 Tax=Cryptosporidium ubiquitum TaxID=857276 RepID=A0A1J4MHP9_9CRYT|nr:adaptin AP complex subunit Alpha [Cryptosporidium ubiquitum]OII73736.1 adaptin AP complex subunit Alpha [Cryptosporidium ubiquitum]
MGTFFCFHSSSERITRKISREINYITKTRKNFDEKANLFISGALKYDNKKSKILIDMIKIELSNSNAAFEKRYLYLCLLDKLIIGNVVYLQLSYQNNLLSYIAMLSEIVDKKEYFKCSEKEDNVMSLCSLAVSCINRWHEKYSGINDELIELLRKFTNNFADSSNIENNSQKNEINNFELNNSIINPDDVLLSEESNNLVNLDIQVSTNLSSPISNNSVSLDKYVGFDAKDNLGDLLNEETSRMAANNLYDRTPNQNILIGDKSVEGDIENADENEIYSTSIQPKSTKVNFIENSVVYSEIETIEMKYNLLKEKYLFLIQKNEYLQSRLEYYEDFNVFPKKIAQDDCYEKNNFELLGNLSNTTKLSSVFLENFNNLILNNDWILFEDNLIQIGVKFQFSENIGNCSLYFGNKLPTRLEDFKMEFNFSNVHPKALSIVKKDEIEYPSYISGKQQICLIFNAECKDVYFGVPTVVIKFLLTDNTPKTIELPFPIVLSKFSYGTEQYSTDFITNLWHSEIYLMSQASSQISLKSSVDCISEIINKCKLNESFYLFFENEDYKKDQIIYLHGNVLNHQVIIQVRESTSQSYILRVRSDSGVLSNSILSIILFQTKVDTF